MGIWRDRPEPGRHGRASLYSRELRGWLPSSGSQCSGSLLADRSPVVPFLASLEALEVIMTHAGHRVGVRKMRGIALGGAGANRRYGLNVKRQRKLD